MPCNALQYPALPIHPSPLSQTVSPGGLIRSTRLHSSSHGRLQTSIISIICPMPAHWSNKFWRLSIPMLLLLSFRASSSPACTFRQRYCGAPPALLVPSRASLVGSRGQGFRRRVCFFFVYLLPLGDFTVVVSFPHALLSLFADKPMSHSPPPPPPLRQHWPSSGYRLRVLSWSPSDAPTPPRTLTGGRGSR